MGNFEQPDETDSPEKALILTPADQVYGINEVYSPPNGGRAVMDIVLVHGLGGSSNGTWTTRPPTSTKSTFWPKDLLPNELPNVRILTFGYDSTPGRILGAASTNMVHQHATNLVTDLHYFRATSDSITRPIVFVCHSLGGIVVKKALITSNSYNISHNDDLRSIRVSTYGVIFMGTPHMGSDLAKWGSLIGSIARAVTLRAWVDSNPALVGTLEKNSEILQNVTEEFVPISGELELFFFWEELPMRLPGNLKQEMVVDYSSAVPQALPNAQKAGIHANHSDMCKFESRKSDGWNVLVGVLKKYADKAPDHIARKWDEEYHRKELATKIGIQDAIAKYNQGGRRTPSPGGRIQDDITPPGISTPKMITGGTAMMEIEEISDDLNAKLLPLEHSPMFKPATLAENAYFVARENELQTIHRVMQKRRVLAIAAGTGQGKTHLARQYFFSHRDHYRAGVFWLECKSLGGAGAGVFSTDVLDQQFTEIAEALALPPTIDFEDEPYVAMSDMVRRRVIQWFEKNEGWLLVLDGVDVLEDEQISDVARYVPLVANFGSIILTTVNHSLAGAARLGSPELLRLRRMEVQDAMNMLFHYAQISHPSEHDRKAAVELLQELDYIPLMIHSAGSYIKSKSMSVTSYLREYKKRPFVDQGKVDVEPFHVIFQNIEQKYPEAHNLLRVLCFFEQQMPIEMLLWGIKALSRKQQQMFIAFEGGRPDFNATVGHLLAHSLIERTPKIDEDAGHTEENMPIDTLRLHSVAQSVAISRMRKESKQRVTLKANLDLAITIFCNSFASLDIRRKDGEFLISDYKRYLVHGHRLLQFSRRYKTPSQRLDEVVKKVQELAEGDTSIERRSMFRTNSMTDSSSLETPTPSSPRGVNSWPWQFEDTHRAHSPEPHDYDRGFDPQYPRNRYNDQYPIAPDEDEHEAPGSPFDERKDQIKRETLRKFIENVNRLREEKPFRFRYEPPSASGGPHGHHFPQRPPFRAFTAVEPRYPRTGAAEAQVNPESVLSTPVEGRKGRASQKETLQGLLSRPTTSSSASSIIEQGNEGPPPSPPILANIFHPRSPGPHYNPLLPSMTPVTASSSNNPHRRTTHNTGNMTAGGDVDQRPPISLLRGRSGSLPNMMLPYTPMPPYPLSPSTEPLANPFDSAPVPAGTASASSTPLQRNRPFTPGFVPPRDITHSPVARSIGIPQSQQYPFRPNALEIYPFPASEPILEVIPPRGNPGGNGGGRGRSTSRSSSTTGSRTVGRRTRTPSPYAPVPSNVGRGRAASTSSSPGPPGLGIGGVRWGFDDASPGTGNGKRHMSLGSGAGLAPPGPTSVAIGFRGSSGAGCAGGMKEASPLRRSSVPGVEGIGGEAMARSTSAPGGPGGRANIGAAPIPSQLSRRASLSPPPSRDVSSAPDSKKTKDEETQTPPLVQTGFAPPPQPQREDTAMKDAGRDSIEDTGEDQDIFHDAQTPGAMYPDRGRED